MLVLDVPGRGRIGLSHLVLDLNGTLAVDGRVPDAVARRVRTRARALRTPGGRNRAHRAVRAGPRARRQPGHGVAETLVQACAAGNVGKENGERFCVLKTHDEGWSEI